MFSDTIFEDERRLSLQCLVFVTFALDLCQEGMQKFRALQAPTSNPFGLKLSALWFRLKLLITRRHANKIFV